MRMDVFVNDRKICTAGIDESGVVDAQVMAIRWKPSENKPGEMFVMVGGMDDADFDAPQYMTWAKEDICVGDEVRIKITDVGEIGTPARAYIDNKAARTRKPS